MKRKRCTICGKLFSPQGIKKHTNWCMKKDAELSDAASVVAAQRASRRTLDEVAYLEGVGKYNPGRPKITTEDMQQASLAIPMVAAERSLVLHITQQLIKSGRIVLVSFMEDSSGNDNDRG